MINGNSFTAFKGTLRWCQYQIFAYKIRVIKNELEDMEIESYGSKYWVKENGLMDRWGREKSIGKRKRIEEVGGQ